MRISLSGGCHRHRLKGWRVLRRWQRGRGHSSEVGLDRGVGSDAAGWKTKGGVGGRQARERRGCWSGGRLSTSVIDRRDDTQLESAGHAAQAALSAEVGVGGPRRRRSGRPMVEAGWRDVGTCGAEVGTRRGGALRAGGAAGAGAVGGRGGRGTREDGVVLRKPWRKSSGPIREGGRCRYAGEGASRAAADGGERRPRSPSRGSCE